MSHKTAHTGKHPLPRSQRAEIYEPLNDLPVTAGVTCKGPSPLEAFKACEVSVEVNGKNTVISQTISPGGEGYITSTFIEPGATVKTTIFDEKSHRLFGYRNMLDTNKTSSYIFVGEGALKQPIYKTDSLVLAEQQAINRVLHTADRNTLEDAVKGLTAIAEDAYALTHPAGKPMRELAPEESNQLVLRMEKVATSERSKVYK